MNEFYEALRRTACVNANPITIAAKLSGPEYVGIRFVPDTTVPIDDLVIYDMGSVGGTYRAQLL